MKARPAFVVAFFLFAFGAVIVLSIQLYKSQQYAIYLERRAFNMESEMRIQKGKCR